MVRTRGMSPHGFPDACLRDRRHDRTVNRRALRARVDELRELLNHWGLLSVRDLTVADDEYDCLLGPLLAKLVAGASTDQLWAHSRETVKHHFGVDPDERDVAGFVDSVNDWWRNATTVNVSK